MINSKRRKNTIKDPFVDESVVGQPQPSQKENIKFFERQIQ